MDAAKISQGGAANRNGKAVERALLPVFAGCSFTVLSAKDAEKHPDKVNGISRYVLTNVPYVSIYGSKSSKTEYVICAENRRIRVELKFQATSGSVDEKYPYMLLNGIYAYPEKEVIFLVDGGGYKAGARQWLQAQIDGNWLDYKGMGKDIQLINLGEFIVWFMKEFG